MAWLLLIPIMVGIFSVSALIACDDDARIDEHNKLTDYLLKLGDEQAEAIERERMAILLDGGGEDADEDEI